MKRSIRSSIGYADNGNPKPLREVHPSPERFPSCKRVIHRLARLWRKHRLYAFEGGGQMSPLTMRMAVTLILLALSVAITVYFLTLAGGGL